MTAREWLAKWWPYCVASVLLEWSAIAVVITNCDGWPRPVLVMAILFTGQLHESFGYQRAEWIQERTEARDVLGLWRDKDDPT